MLTFVETLRSVSYERTVTVQNEFNFSPLSGDGVSFDEIGLFRETLVGPDFVSSDPFAPLSVSGLNPIASQSTLINFNSISGTGSYDGRFFGDPGPRQQFVDQGESAVRVVFDLSGPTQYSFSASTGDGDAFVRLLGEDAIPGQTFPFERSIAGTSLSGGRSEISQTGVLEAGRYELIANRNFDFISLPTGNSGSFEFDLQLEVVPEPSTLPFLLAATITGLTKRRRQWSAS